MSDLKYTVYSSLSLEEFKQLKVDLGKLEADIREVIIEFGEVKKVIRADHSETLSLNYETVSNRNRWNESWVYSFGLSYLEDEKLFSIGAMVSEIRVNNENIRYCSIILKKAALANIRSEIKPLLKLIFGFFTETNEENLDKTQTVIFS